MSIFIFRRDFRKQDNTGLIECCKHNKSVHPIFIFTPEQITDNRYKSSNAVQFMIESLKDLKQSIGTLNILYGDYLKVLKDIVVANNITSIYTNTDYTPYAKFRDAEIEKLCQKLKIKFYCFHDICLLKPGIILNKSDKPYQKFTPFYKTCIKQTPPPVNKYNVSSDNFKSISSIYSIDWKTVDTYYTYNPSLNIIGGRNNALSILQNLKNDKYKSYGKDRDNLLYETTQLSGYLKFGCISIREVYQLIYKKYGIDDPIIRQLYWRDFYYQIGYFHPKVLGKSLKSKYDKIKWSKNKHHLNAWKNGETGFPIVDACMTQLNTTGYMHNRGRLIVASFLIKNLQIDWREGEKYFATQLLDYDPLVNNGNWQWVSGSGADSQQYIRIFNPWTQSKKADSKAEYVKYWLPVFKNITKKDIHKWDSKWDKYDIDYPKMIVDYKQSREITLEMYKTALYLDKK